MQTSRHIFLIGFMGCGKSHWGRLLAENLGLPFQDLDDLITSRTGKSIPEIFTQNGESRFRQLEHEALQSLTGIPPSVIATGGGTPCFYDHMEWMNRNGLSIYLKTAPSVLAERLRNDKTIRPLLTEVKDSDLKAFIAEKLKEREAFYSQAELILEQTDDQEKNWDQLLGAIDGFQS